MGLVKWVERTNTEEEANKEFVKAMIGMTTPNTRLQKSHDERLFDRERNDFMSISTPDMRLQTPHKERYKRYVEGATRNLLHGDIDPEVSKEGTKFIQNHKLRDLYNDDECILLFEPVDEDGF